MGEGSTTVGADVRHDHERTGTATPSGRRPEVVRRLLERGLSPNVLSIVLPEFADTIAVVGDAH